MQAVVDIVSERGIEGLSINQIAEQAQVSVATLYNLIGSLHDIIDQLVANLFEDFQRHLEKNDAHSSPELIFEDFIDANYQFLHANERRNRAGLLAIFHISIAGGRSRLSAAVTRDNQDILTRAVLECQKAGLIKTAVNGKLLAEQMVFVHGMLLESWAAKVICLERFRLTCSFHIWSLVRAWAEEPLIPIADEIIMQRQQSIISLDKKRSDQQSRAERSIGAP